MRAKWKKKGSAVAENNKSQDEQQQKISFVAFGSIHTRSQSQFLANKKRNKYMLSNTQLDDIIWSDLCTADCILVTTQRTHPSSTANNGNNHAIYWYTHTSIDNAHKSDLSIYISLNNISNIGWSWITAKSRPEKQQQEKQQQREKKHTKMKIDQCNILTLLLSSSLVGALLVCPIHSRTANGHPISACIRAQCFYEGWVCVCVLIG